MCPLKTPSTINAAIPVLELGEDAFYMNHEQSEPFDYEGIERGSAVGPGWW